MKIRITSDENWKHDPEKEVMTLKNVTEISQMTLNDPNFDLKNSLDTMWMI